MTGTEELIHEFEQQNKARRIIAKYAREQVEHAAIILTEMAGNPNTKMGQVKACELVLEWSAGGNGSLVSIPDFQDGDDLQRAMDLVVRETLHGNMPVEVGNKLLDLLKKRGAMMYGAL